MAGGHRWAACSGRPSSASSEGSGASWEGGDEDFYSQMDENGIIGLKEVVQDDDSEGGAALTWGSEGDPPTPAEHHLPDQSFHLSELQDSLSPGEDSHALSVYDLGERTPHSGGSGTEEEDRSWLTHRLTETDPQMDLTDEEREEGEEDEEDFSRNSDPLGCSDSLCSDSEESRDGHCWRGSPKLPQGEDPSLAGCLQDGDVAEVHMSEPSGDSQGDENEGSRLRDALTALPPSSPLRPPLTAGGHRERLTWHASTPADLQLLHLGTEEPAAGAGFEGLAESLTESCSSLESHASTAGQLCESEGDGSPDGLTFTTVSPPPGLRQERCPGSRVEEADDEEEEEDDEEEEEQEEEEEEEDGRAHEEATRTNPPPLLPEKLKTKHHHAPHEAPPSLTLQRAHEGRSSPLNSTPCRTVSPRVRRGHSALGKGSPKPSGASPVRSSQDSGRYGKGQLNYPLPDFSKVEPRVRFPKEGYRPPRSKGRPRKKGPGSEPPLVFKSPADIVREVLLSSADTPSPPTGPLRPPNTTLPQEFRSPQQATALVHQLQEDYRRLLTKYAEAENTIDRLRLEAKVGLYSDPPKPSHPVHSGTLHVGSKVVTLTFPQAQRAELDPGAVSHLSVTPDPGEKGASPGFPSAAASSSPCSLGPGFGERLTQALSTQAERFQMQVESCEELLRRGKLKPCEQLKALSRLVQGQDSLERGYLGAREKHRLLQLQGRDVGPFDPDRELEGEIFRSGMRLEELKEHVQQAAPVQADSVAPPSPPPPGLDTTISPLRAGTPTPHPENPAFSAGMAVTSVSGGSEGEEERSGEEELPRPRCVLHHRHQHQEIDLSHLLDSGLNLGEVPHLLDFGQGEGFPTSAAAHALSPQDYGIPMEPRRTERDGRTVAQLPPGGAKEAFLASPPGHTGLHHHQPLPRSPAFPRQQGQELKGVAVKSPSSSMASVGESAPSEGRASHLQNAFRTAPLQDGILSPETDSGFVGSESSHLTVAAHGPVQQRARASDSAALEEGGGTRPPISVQPRPSSTLQGHTLQDSSRVARGNAGGPRLGGRGGRPPRSPSAASSPRQWPSSVSSECDPESDRTHGVSEGEEVCHGVRHTQTANQQLRHQRSPSPTVLHHYSDPVRVRGSEQPTGRHQALRSLQTEVSRLREQLEGSLRRTGHSLSTTVPPAGLGDPLQSQHSAPYSRITQHQAGNERAEEEEEEDGETEQRERNAEAPRPTPRRRPSVPRLKPELDITSDSEHVQFTSKPHVARGIPESSATQRGRRRARTEAVKHRGPYTGQQWSFTASGGREDVDQREGRSFLHPHGASHSTVEPPGGKGRAGGVSATHPRSGRRPRAQGSRLGRDRTRPGNNGHSTERSSGSTPRSTEPIGSPHRGVFVAAPPPPVPGSVPLVQCVPVCPSVLYYSTPAPVSMVAPPYPQPFYLSLGGGAGGGGASRFDPAPSAEQSLSRSLSRAIEAARCMRVASQRMARSLSTSLLHQGAPSQTCLH
ncbi:microtubule organization protein AKNA-like isoform X2 [Megalops cyprinoides]|uniref:microtubule organization protein AKNA-like isoform X2 n=1 Tax=Megalops cyprinoides TaxID=118141 RepID=UPI0018649462|nr:microtubule organization protein AKNA-like isoform X2 [Megalops cyprinoides]